MSDNPILWSPDQKRIEDTAMYAFMRKNGFDDYDDLHRWSVTDSPAFWEALVSICDVEFETR